MTMYDGRAILVNLDRIESVVEASGERKKLSKFSYLSTVDLLREGAPAIGYDVKESVDEIHKLVSDALRFP